MIIEIEMMNRKHKITFINRIMVITRIIKLVGWRTDILGINSKKV